MKYIYLMLTALAISKASADGQIYGWSSDILPDEVQLQFNAVTRSNFHNGQGNYCKVHAYINYKTQKGQLLRAWYESIESGGPTCWGYTLPGDPPGDSKDSWEWESVLYQMSKKTWKLKYINSIHYGQTPDTCGYVTTLSGPRYIVQSAGGPYEKNGEPCTLLGRLPPDPVSCHVLAPDPIVHTTASAGLIQRRAIGAINVSCTADSRVLLSVQNSELQLESKGQTIRTALYLEQDGQTSAFVDPTPNGTIKLISVIDAQADTPGTYQGSKVIIADLP
ncbi:hypothetical protein [Serratia fonticola]|uniref:hypothetical protein n=1 Tax=Serratia fonticola TaxID=47917 RepID=UPI001378271C|nr:hypothetical protein [Serratia fonticola]NCG52483.1 hypothetical protein [Serratia fonticola]